MLLGSLINMLSTNIFSSKTFNQAFYFLWHIYVVYSSRNTNLGVATYMLTYAKTINDLVLGWSKITCSFRGVLESHIQPCNLYYKQHFWKREIIKMTAFWNMICSLIQKYLHFRRVYGFLKMAAAGSSAMLVMFYYITLYLKRQLIIIILQDLKLSQWWRFILWSRKWIQTFQTNTLLSSISVTYFIHNTSTQPASFPAWLI
jgi:hypothetical protein